jgi:signal transduction histidine kinase
MTRRNLERAAHLVQSFKQVSVDRTSDGRREFELGAYLDELEQSSHSLWKHRPIEVSVACAGVIRLDSFPGPLGQVLTNLIQNALLHAFPPERTGRIHLTARDLDGEHFEICVIDDGLGIEADVLPRIFEPFFTTKRNQGGTGLGMQIVANLISQKLGGRIEVESTPGQGTTVRLTLPRRAPTQQDAT